VRAGLVVRMAVLTDLVTLSRPARADALVELA